MYYVDVPYKKRILLVATLGGLALTTAGALVLATHAMAGEKRNAPAAVARPAAGLGGGMHMPGGMAGGVHMPGGMAGGAHMPGNLGGGAHLPGGMAGGAHMPGNMGGGTGGAHMPGSMAGGAHMPGGVAHEPSNPRGEPGSSEHAARGYGGQGSVHAQRAGFSRPAAGHASEASRAGLHDERGHDERARDARGRDERGRDEKTALRGDPRIGGRAALHTRGLVAGAALGAGAAGLAAHHGAAGFLNRPDSRDINHDRAFAAAHARDFHARYVRDFTPAEYARWRGGDWSAGWHFGRFGWWWDVGGVWYPYAEPIYPYPLEVAALAVYADDYHDPGYPVAQGPSIPPLPAAPAALYSCASPQGFYPAVTACSQPWQVASAPPDQGAPAN